MEKDSILMVLASVMDKMTLRAPVHTTCMTGAKKVGLIRQFDRQTSLLS